MSIQEVSREYANKTLTELDRAREAIGELQVIRAGDPLVPLVCAFAARALVEAGNAIADLLSDAPAAPAARVRPPGEHRHKFDASNHCTVCGKEKAAGGRKPAAAADAPPVDVRTAALPFKPNPDAADRHLDGGLGSSGMRR